MKPKKLGQKNKIDARTIQRVERSTRGLQDVLFEDVEKLKDGQLTIGRANSMARLVGQICDTVRLEIEVQQHLERQSRIAEGPSINRAAAKTIERVSLGE